MISKTNHCISCKQYYKFKESLCSNCYKFKITGVYNIIPNRESKLLNELQCKYINSKKLSFLIKLVTNNLSITCDEIYDIIEKFDIYMNYNNAIIIYNLIGTNDYSKNNFKLKHILSYRILDFWNNRLGGPSCYYDNAYDIPYNLENAVNVLKANKRHFKNYILYHMHYNFENGK